MISETDLNKLVQLILSGRVDNFYQWPEWKQCRNDVLQLDHHECQICKEQGRYCKAVIVHHRKHVKNRPDLAMSIWDGEERQLISLCKSCHEEEHPESQRQYRKIRSPLTQERWD